MKRILLLISILTAVLISCTLSTTPAMRPNDVYFLSVACAYIGDYNGARELEGTLNDQTFLDRQLEYLASQSDSSYHAYLLQNGTVDGSLQNESDRNLITVKQDGTVITQNDIAPEDFIAGFRETVSLIASEAEADDVLIFHYSGHGNNDGGLCLPDGSGGYSVLSLSELVSLLGEIRCGGRLVMLDSCYSGNIVTDSDTDSRQSLADLFSPYEGSVSSFWFSAASSSDELSWSADFNGVDLGIHTARVLNALGFDLTSMTAGRRDPDYVSFNRIISRLAAVEVPGRTQHYTSSESIRDLVIFNFQ